MYIHIPIGIWIVTFGSIAAFAAYILWSLARGAEAAGLSSSQRTQVVAFTSVAIAAWAALVVLLASHGVFEYNTAIPFPTIAAGILAPLITGVLLLVISPVLRASVYAIPQYRLIGAQSVRLLGVSFLILMAIHQLPAEFALPAGIGDILVGLFAVVLAREYYKGNRSVATAAVAWNFAGILDLVDAVAIGFLASTTPFRLIFSTPATDAMAALPMVLIPVFAIPLFFLLHGVSLTKLRMERQHHLVAGDKPELFVERTSLL